MDIKFLLNKKVSYQKNAWSNLGEDTTIKEVLSLIKDGKFQKEVLTLRQFLERDENEKYDTFKKLLPGVTFSGTFFNQRRKEALINYNRILVIDIDKLSQEELLRIKGILFSDPHVFAYWESPSKNGIKGLLSLNFNREIDASMIHDEHKLAFNLIYTYFKSTYNIILDKSGSDITRLCFLSFDADLIIKETCPPFEIIATSITPKQTKITHKKKNQTRLLAPIKQEFLDPKGKNSPSDRKTIQSIIKYLSKRNLSITYNYENWYRVGYAIANTFTHDIGLKYYLSLCRLDGPKHDEDQSKNLLYYCYSNTKGEISFKTIYFLAQEKGYKNKGGSEGDVLDVPIKTINE